jgi:hypothetical protein
MSTTDVIPSVQNTSNTNSNFTPRQLDLGMVVNDPPDSMIQTENTRVPLESQRDYKDRRDEHTSEEERVRNPKNGGQPQVTFNLVENDDLSNSRGGDSTHITSLDSSSSDDDDDEYRRRPTSSSSSSSKYSNSHRDRDSDDGRSDTNSRRKVFVKLRGFCQKNGYDFPSHLHQDSPLSELKAHLVLIKSEKNMENSVEMCKRVLVGVISVFEYTNNRYDPLGLRMDGWSEQILSEGDEYDEVFEELYDKHQSKFDISPEMKLMMLIAGSGAAYHVQNSMMSGKKQSIRNSSSSNHRQAPHAPPQQAGAVSDPRYEEDPEIQDILHELNDHLPDTMSQNSIGTTSSAMRSKRSNATINLADL